MEKLTIRTAQNVGIQQNLAGVGIRLVAALIDMFFLSIFYFFLFYLLEKSGISDKFSSWTFISVLMLPYFLYYPLMQYWNNGQTLGKQLVKIRVVKIDNSHPRIGDFLVRWIFRLVESNFLVGFSILIMMLNDKRQRLGDIVAKTTVISEEKKVSLNHSIFEDINQDYQPVFQQAQLLSEEDARLIKTVFTEAKNRNNLKVLKQLTQKVENILQVQRPQDMPYLKFIDIILKDYNYYMRK
jgi:uncharacterized RDD family membrane protein YckC